MVSSYIILRIAQSTLRFTSLTDLFNQTPSQLLWEASSHMLQLMREGCSYTYPPLSIARYSFILPSELEQCRVKKLATGFNTAAHFRTRVLLAESPKLYPPSYSDLHTKGIKTEHNQTCGIMLTFVTFLKQLTLTKNWKPCKTVNTRGSTLCNEAMYVICLVILNIIQFLN